MSRSDNIEKLRFQIDELDQRLLGLLNKRIELAKQVGIIKNDSQDNTVYRPDREANILSRLSEINKGPLEAAQVQTIFREIISISRAAEARPSVAFLGPEGTYSELAVKKHFGSEVKHILCGSIEETFQSVETRQAQHGVVPVENSTEGGVSNTLNCLVTTPVTIVGEITLRISHALLGNAATNESIKTVLGHKQALAQCRRWLDQHLPLPERLAVSSNAEAARQASLDDECVAIAGIEAGEVYGLKIIRKGIEDEPNNSTRFLVISNQLIEPSGRDKISLLLASQNKSGSLHRLLTPLSDNGISMTRIESRPSRMGLWEYIFFIDLEGHVNDENVQNALENIEKEAALFKILGCYPRAV